MIIVQNLKEENEKYWMSIDPHMLAFKIYTIIKPNNVKVITKNSMSSLKGFVRSTGEFYTVEVSRKFDNLKSISGDSSEYVRILEKYSGRNAKYIIHGIDEKSKISKDKIDHYKNLLYYNVITQEQYERWTS
jgi:5'-3' exonuclease